MPYLSPFRCPNVLFGGKSPFLSSVGPVPNRIVRVLAKNRCHEFTGAFKYQPYPQTTANYRKSPQTTTISTNHHKPVKSISNYHLKHIFLYFWYSFYQLNYLISSKTPFMPLAQICRHIFSLILCPVELAYYDLLFLLLLWSTENRVVLLIPQKVKETDIRGGIKKFWASGIFPIQIVQCFTPNVQKCVRYWLHLGSYCWLSLFSHNTWSKIHTPIELAKWTKLSTERW